MRDEYRYLDKEIRIHPDTGKFWCPDYGLEADTLEEVKAGIKERVEVRKTLPKQDVWFYPDRGPDDELLVKGTSTCAADARSRFTPEVWVIRGSGRHSRMKKYYYSVYVRDAKNDAIVSQINAITAQIAGLEKDRNKLREKLTAIIPLDEAGEPIKENK